MLQPANAMESLVDLVHGIVGESRRGETYRGLWRSKRH